MKTAIAILSGAERKILPAIKLRLVMRGHNDTQNDCIDQTDHTVHIDHIESLVYIFRFLTKSVPALYDLRKHRGFLGNVTHMHQ